MIQELITKHWLMILISVMSNVWYCILGDGVIVMMVDIIHSKYHLITTDGKSVIAGILT